ncbi:MAG: methylated-DNA--[protein]-cysteine S-methyltransferase [Acidimicrobiia bacterium]
MSEGPTERLVDRLQATAPPATTDELVAGALDRAAAEGLVEVAWDVLDTPIGALTVAVTGQGLVRVGFGHEEGLVDELARRISPRVVRVPAMTDPVRRELDEYFAGARRRFEVRLDWQLSRGFRRTVLERLVDDVAYGEVSTYKDLAVGVGNPGASRAVGSAMATNPIPVVVPCHRVLRTGGDLGGYGGGLPTKEWLLRHERALLV